MKKIIFSINGGNDIGKTTFIELLKDRHYFIDSLNIKSDKLSNENWWFNESSPMEFIDEIIRSLHKRNEEMTKSDKPIILLDKGIDTMRARVYATFKFRNYSDEIIEKYLTYFDKNVNDLESFSCRILLDSKILLNKSSKYYLYNQIQLDYLKKQIFDYKIEYQQYPGKPEYEFFIELIKEKIINGISKKALKLNKKIYGITGMSESGKSSVGKYLDEKYNIWNLKIKYFLDKVKQKYNIDDESTFLEIFAIDELIRAC